MFFRYFPNISYKVDNYTAELTDITVGFLQKRLFLNSAYKFRRYTILEGERPEEVSYKLYGTTRFHWVLLFLNRIVDPLTDWFMSTDLLWDFTEAKYPEIPLDPTKRSGIFGINHFRFYYDEQDSNKFFRLDPIDDKKWRYRGGRNYLATDQIIITPPEDPEGVTATAYINRIDNLGAITDIVVTDPGVGYNNVPEFEIITDSGVGFEGEIILDNSSEIQDFIILPIGEEIHPITNLHVETENNINRREILAITPDKITYFEEELYHIMEQI